MNEKYNLRISQIAGLFLQLTTEIEGDNTLLVGEKFLILQQLVSNISPAIKKFEDLKKEIENWAKENLLDTENGKSKEVTFEGASVLIKYSYPRPSLDGDKLAVELERVYNDLNVDFNKTDFLKESSSRKSVIIQTLLKK